MLVEQVDSCLQSFLYVLDCVYLKIEDEGLFLYNSRKVNKYTNIKGPKIKPSMPKAINPPIIPIKITTEGSLIFLATKYGLIKLSIQDIKIAP